MLAFCSGSLPDGLRFKRARFRPRACAAAPGTFSFSEYVSRRARLDVALDWCTLRMDEEAPRDSVHVDAERSIIAIADYGEQPGAAACVKKLVHSDSALYTQQATTSLTRRVSAALRESPGSAAVMTATMTDAVLRVAWAGAMGFILIRDDRVVARSHKPIAPASALEGILNAPTVTEGVSSDFVLLQDGDVVVFGSDGLFANLDEIQLLAMIRPVPDPLDSVLSIANNTCLGSWTHPDPSLLSYNIAHLAYNFGAASNSGPLLAFPFPPSPHADDVTVVVAAIEISDD